MNRIVFFAINEASNVELSANAKKKPHERLEMALFALGWSYVWPDSGRRCHRRARVCDLFSCQVIFERLLSS